MTSIRTKLGWFFVSSLLMGVAFIAPSTPSSPQSKPTQATPGKGKNLFAKKCAPCHGANGGGGAGYSSPLAGDLSVDELSQYIATSMPPGPKKTPVKDAKEIAAFVHNEFYSPIAQERNRPAKITLARLTVKQFKNAVSDLINDSPPVVNGAPGGLSAQYYKEREKKKENKILDRVDPEINFEFPPEGPVPGQGDGRQYSIVWFGNVIAPDSGEYEFAVQTDQSVKLFINNSKEPLIDAWVKSGNETEFKNSIVLTGGRSYPVYMDWTKAQIGVKNDQKAPKPAPAFVRLLWKRPKGNFEPVPSAYLSKNGMAPSYVVSTAFPADDRSIGYERGNAVNKAWDDAVTSAALDAGEYVAKHINELAKTNDQAPDRVEKIKRFCTDFVTRAFRRPLTPEEIKRYLENHFEGSTDLSLGIRKVVVMTLKSPYFLYHSPSQQNDSWSRAAELAFALWDSVPDPELRAAAAKNELITDGGLRKQAERLASHPRAWTKLRDFLMLWLKVDEFPDIVKSKTTFPEFNPRIVNDLRTSLDLYLKANAASKESTFSQLMLSETMFMNERLSKVYGGSVADKTTFQPTPLPDRAGILTHPYLLSRLAYLEGSSPIHRGVLVARSMMGRTLSPPPEAFAPLPASLHPEMTTRERVQMQTKPETCNTCHSMINPLGFTLESYDAIGRVRQNDNGKPVDTSGKYKTRQGDIVQFKNAAELSKFIATSDESQKAFVEKLFQYMHKQPIRAYGSNTSNVLHQSFRNNQLNIRNLMISIALTPAPEPKPEK
jgi:hypothetical protein